ncbi:thaumatin family protein [Amycolatopsis suaedae]|uniref:Thaumatin pathogenesis-like protein n=1 Tax=Amycolatopsis suaedae TaxID=2510978 RepID=A0A4Q7JAH3_9PSEU|nr:thaumatin family protein [Amycolatopsis suaedae]RZQ63922.1 Thaumatin pathogenesis-like protein [Amycolatopsis suaedae]
MRRIRCAVLALVTAATAVTGNAAAAQAADHTVTFVNRSGQTIWIGSAVNADGSRNLTGLPMLHDTQQATVTIPESGNPPHWRGKFFARQNCTGTPGSTFRCAIGDCGNLADRCTTGEQPASLAEFNFDRNDPMKLAPWYNVSYVNAVSLSITIDARDAQVPPGSKECESVGCSDRLLESCPPENLTRDPAGRPVLCVNPNRDARTPYSNAISSRCPKAYAWSKQDAEQGNQTVRQCRYCTGFVVTFHRGS